jgi:hypothetical protein
MEPGSTKTLKCSNIGVPLDDEKLEELKEKGMKYWKYEAANVDSGHTTELKLELA